MVRYFSLPRAARQQRAEFWEWRDEPFRPCLTVSDHEAADTGLLDARGDPIMRAPNQMGFVWEGKE